MDDEGLKSLLKWFESRRLQLFTCKVNLISSDWQPAGARLAGSISVT
jgi:hypothetical protein